MQGTCGNRRPGARNQSARTFLFLNCFLHGYPVPMGDFFESLLTDLVELHIIRPLQRRLSIKVRANASSAMALVVFLCLVLFVFLLCPLGSLCKPSRSGLFACRVFRALDSCLILVEETGFAPLAARPCRHANLSHVFLAINAYGCGGSFPRKNTSSFCGSPLCTPCCAVCGKRSDFHALSPANRLFRQSSPPSNPVSIRKTKISCPPRRACRIFGRGDGI